MYWDHKSTSIPKHSNEFFARFSYKWIIFTVKLSWFFRTLLFTLSCIMILRVFISSIIFLFAHSLMHLRSLMYLFLPNSQLWNWKWGGCFEYSQGLATVLQNIAFLGVNNTYRYSPLLWYLTKCYFEREREGRNPPWEYNRYRVIRFPFLFPFLITC